MNTIYKRAQGFTIVELLIVIVVIAILAAVTIVSYNGISTQARDSALKTELSGANQKILSYQAENSVYPDSLAAAGLAVRTGIISNYGVSSKGYCITFQDGNLQYSISSQTGVMTTGACTPIANGYVSSTLAGTSMNGAIGYQDGTGSGAQFHSPRGVVIDKDGSLFVADCDNNRIRKVTPSGIVTTFAGSGAYASTDGIGTSAAFYTPSAIAIDSAGNLYVADSGTSKIRKITPSGVVTTLAGTTSGAIVNGAGTTARFNNPTGLAVDASGNVYVADNGNHAIRKILPSGVVSTFAGGTYGYLEGTATAAQFKFPSDVAVDASGTVYVSDTQNYRIRKITSNGVTSAYAGSGTAGLLNATGTAARFNNPTTLALDATGNLYVIDGSGLGKYMRLISSSAVVSTVAGTGTYSDATGAGLSTDLAASTGLAVNVAGVVYVGDTDNHRILKLE